MYSFRCVLLLVRWTYKLHASWTTPKRERERGTDSKRGRFPKPRPLPAILRRQTINNVHICSSFKLSYRQFTHWPIAGSPEAAQLDAECAESVQQASSELPSSFGGCFGADQMPPPLDPGSFKTRLLAVFLSALISRRKVRTLFYFIIISLLKRKS